MRETEVQIGSIRLKMTPRVFRRWRRAIARSVLLFFFLFGALQPAAIAKGKLLSYVEKGKVVAVRVDEHTDYVPVSPTDSKGRTHGGEAFVHRKQVYRVETDDGIYELGGGKDPTMAVGDAVEFCIEKGTAHVRAGVKEKKYRIISTTPKPNLRSAPPRTVGGVGPGLFVELLDR